MIVLGFDPGSKSLGWACLAPEGGRYALAGYGHFSPGKLESRDLRDRYFIAFKEAQRIIQAVSSLRKPVAVGVEHTAIFAQNARTMEVMVSMSTALRCAAWQQKVALLDVFPISWQSMIKVKGLSGKEASSLLSEQIYGAAGLTEDESDAVGIAHYVSHMSNEKLFLDKMTRVLEEGISDENLYRLRRDMPEKAYRKVFFSHDRVTKEDSKNFVLQMRSYQDRLRKFRRSYKMTSASKVKIDGGMPAGTTDDSVMADLKAALEKFKEKN
jgi:Holliday junction resolvasome RuvABC endonuclease subunit